jgi:hypothetical protein
LTKSDFSGVADRKDGSIPFLQKYLAIEIAATQTMSACADCLKTLALRV